MPVNPTNASGHSARTPPERERPKWSPNGRDTPSTKPEYSGMGKAGKAEVARLVELARAAVAEKLQSQPDPVPVWAYRTIIRTVLAEVGREDP